VSALPPHKRIGIIGGLSPESTATYYLHITRTYTAHFGTDGYPEVLIYSLNLEQFHHWREAGRWDLIADTLAGAANNLQAAGADFGVIATNTMHKVFDAVRARTALPLLHILDPTIVAIRAANIRKIGLLGTRFTMEDDFYRTYLAQAEIDSATPAIADQGVIHDIIVQELVRGVFRQEARAQYLDVIERLAAQGAHGIILGCTEIPLLVRPEHCPMPLFDTATLHADAALRLAVVDRW
jgi:aspartate racemase